MCMERTMVWRFEMWSVRGLLFSRAKAPSRKERKERPGELMRLRNNLQSL